MIEFYAYAPDGRIVMTGWCPEDMLHLQSCPGCEIAAGPADVGKVYRADDGTLVPIPPAPAANYVFDYATKTWVQDLDAAWTAVRTERDSLLQASDWTQLPDVSLSNKDAWATYRQALRDVTEQPDPFSIVWPTPPG